MALISIISQLSARKMVVFSACTVLIGVVAVAVIFAAGPLAAFEPENGSLAGAVAITDSPGASNGKMIQFGADTTTPTPTPGQTLNCYATPTTPHLCGFPDATTTGIETGHTLTAVPASGTSAGPGWTSSNGELNICAQSCSGAKSSTVSDLEVPLNHSASITGSNVVVSNLKIKGQSGRTTPTDFEGVVVSASAHGVVIDHCDIAGDAASPLSGPASPAGGTVNRGDAAIQLAFNSSNGGYGVTVSNCNIHGFHGPIWNRRESAGPTQAESQVRITRNYIHAIECWDYVDNQSCPVSIPKHGSTQTDHCNLYGQSNASFTAAGNQNVLIDNNTMAMDYQPCATAIVSADSDNGQTNNLKYVVHHNLLAYPGGGDICIAPGRSGASPKVAGSPSYVAVTHNHLAGCERPLYDGPSLKGTGVGQSPNNIECGNMFDDNIGSYATAGFSIDVYAYYDQVAANRPAVTACGTLPWTIPNYTGLP